MSANISAKVIKQYDRSYETSVGCGVLHHGSVATTTTRKATRKKKHFASEVVYIVFRVKI